MKQRKIELLAPAKNLECGLAAVEHGADAIYIGAPSFSARSSAGNSIEDIKKLCDYAHYFGVKVYVALNTILKDKDLPLAEKLIWDLWDKANIDALIIQDFGITKLNLPPVPLHASTQMDNRTPEKSIFLEKIGFQQIVLPRELSLEEIQEIAKNVSVPLEFFVHGALCVSYSGQCYISQALAKRSANEGKCAQYCRLPYTLKDANNQIMVNNKHLLSMKDLNLSSHLETVIDAGISSLKIEGRMKDVSYVKNVVSLYRSEIDKIISKRPEYIHSSFGISKLNFEPNLSKSFNRGFSSYFLFGRQEESKDLWSIDSPKSIGEPIGYVAKSTHNSININSREKIVNGDGLCYIDENETLTGFQVNDSQNNIIRTKSTIKKGTQIFRNYNHEFEQLLSRNNTARRTLLINFTLKDTIDGYLIEATELSRQILISKNIICPKELAKKDQIENIINTFKKTGSTIFEVNDVNLELSENYFIALSSLSEWKRNILDELLETIKLFYTSRERELTHFIQTAYDYPLKEITYLGNIMNQKAKEFYEQHHCKVIEMAFEMNAKEDVPLMFMKHCIKYSLGICPKSNSNQTSEYKEPFKLEQQGQVFNLLFDCKRCEMKIVKA